MRDNSVRDDSVRDDSVRSGGVRRMYLSEIGSGKSSGARQLLIDLCRVLALVQPEVRQLVN